MKFDIGEFYEGLLCPMNFYSDQTVLITILHVDLLEFLHISQAEYVIFQARFLEKRITHFMFSTIFLSVLQINQTPYAHFQISIFNNDHGLLITPEALN